MLNKVLILILLIVLCSSLILAEEFKIDKAVYNELEDKIEIPVIIKVGSNESGEIGKVLDGEIRYGDLVVVEVDEDKLEELVESELVEKVEYSYPIRALLDDSIKVINADDIWSYSLNGINITGIDETICVIDTGVDFSHADLIGKNMSCVIDCYNKACEENCNIGDDSGHGTHVAGILAASGGIEGISPGSNLIGVKVLDSLGNGHPTTGTVDLANAINWCSANSLKYNVSVISMSLGTTDLFSDYCDSSFSSTLTNAINNATSLNISVVASTGNSGAGTSRSTISISSPACIENVTSVSATNKDSTLSSYGHYNYLTDLFAPGSNIRSTYPGGYFTQSGTSMSAPHVAGAYALLGQFYKLQRGLGLMPKDGLEIFREYGKKFKVDDLNFTSIDILSSIDFLREPNVTLESPNNGTFTRFNQTFFCNATSDFWGLSNLTIFIYNETELISDDFKNVSGLTNISLFDFEFPKEGSYKWSCLANNNESFSRNSNNYSISYDLTNPTISVINPKNGSWHNRGEFNITLSESGSCVYNIDFNISMDSNGLNFGAINSSLSSGNYNVTFYCNDSAGNLETLISSFNIDISVPEVLVHNPIDGYTASEGGFDFEFNTSDNLNISTCGLYGVGDSVIVDDILLNGFNKISKSVSPGVYNWQINCTDEAGNIGSSEIRVLTVNALPVSSVGSSSGGSGGGSTKRSSQILIPDIVGGEGEEEEEKVQLSPEAIVVENNEKVSPGITGKIVDESGKYFNVGNGALILGVLTFVFIILVYFSIVSFHDRKMIINKGKNSRV